MANYVVHGGKRLEGILRIHGAKNAVLPILAASLLSEESVLENCPDLTDVHSALRILEHLGCTTSRRGSELHISTQGCTRWSTPPHRSASLLPGKDGGADSGGGRLHTLCCP